MKSRHVLQTQRPVLQTMLRDDSLLPRCHRLSEDLYLSWQDLQFAFSSRAFSAA